jgi:zinc protease
MKKLALILALILFAVPVRAADIQEVTSRSGVTAWLIEDHKLPLVSMHFAFRGGLEQDPADKQGLATLTMDLLTEGAGEYDAAAFQQELADHSITLHFDAGRDDLGGSLKCLSSDRQMAFGLLRDALAKPHFDAESVERMRAAQMAALQSQFGNPGWQARYALFQRIFGGHPYGERRLGSPKTLVSITRNDIVNFAAHHLARDNLVVAVAGDMTRQQLAAALDQMFGDLPKHAHLAHVNEIVWPDMPASILVSRAGTQTELLFAMPGPKRKDPDWFAAEIANYVLGGGGFSSRLMHDVRDKKGLTYGISTDLSPMEHGGLIVGEAATDNPKTAEAWETARDTMHEFYDNGPTDEEITAAKDYLTGSLPLMMTSTDEISGLLVDIQLQRLGREYLDRRNDMIRAVTKDDVQKAVHRWFNPDSVTLSMVGSPDNMQPTITREQTRN